MITNWIVWYLDSQEMCTVHVIMHTFAHGRNSIKVNQGGSCRGGVGISGQKIKKTPSDLLVNIFEAEQVTYWSSHVIDIHINLRSRLLNGGKTSQLRFVTRHQWFFIPNFALIRQSRFRKEQLTHICYKNRTLVYRWLTKLHIRSYGRL